MPGLLEYLSDGIIPFLQAFYDYFFDPSEATADEMDNQYFVSAEITKSLMVGVRHHNYTFIIMNPIFTVGNAATW